MAVEVEYDYRKKLLMFLFEAKSKSIEIYQVSENKDYSNKDIKEALKSLSTDELIEVFGNYREVGSGSPRKPNTLKSLQIKARITPTGENYVRDNYFPNEHSSKFSAKQIVYITGDNSGQIAQADNQSSPRLDKKNITPKNPPPKTIIRMLVSKKSIVLMIIAVIAGLLTFWVTNYR